MLKLRRYRVGVLCWLLLGTCLGLAQGQDEPQLDIRATTPFGQPGDAFDWIVRVSNPGAAALDDVGVTLTFPPNVQLVSATANNGQASLDHRAAAIRYRVATLAPRQTVDLRMRARLDPTYSDSTIPVRAALSTAAGHIGTTTEAYAVVVDAQPVPDASHAWRTPALVLLALGGFLILIASLNGQVQRG